MKTLSPLCLMLAAVASTAAAQAANAAKNASTIDYATAHLDRNVTIVRAAGRIVLDGVLDEADWRDAPVARNFVQNDPHEGQPATYDTEVRLVYDNEALYIGVFAKDDQPSRLIVSDLKKDFGLDTGDSFRVVIDTFHDGRNGYEFATNPAGAKWDSQMANEGRENNVNWDGIWTVASRITELGWYAEIRVPFKAIKFESTDVQTWGVNFQRKIRRLNEDSYWAPVPRIYDIERVSLAGTVQGMKGIRPGKNLRVKPYALRNSSTIGGKPSTGSSDVGLDVKYGLTSGLTWDFTVNTDFSQAEADEQQINLSRFSLLFPEKRDFFLENSGIFLFGGGGATGGSGNGRQNASQDMRLFFSRRIGLSDVGDAIPIGGGTRLTGRQGAYSMGVLNIQQREQGLVPSTNFTAVRLRRDIFANSDIGAIVLDKEESGPRYNRVAGVDANFRFGFFAMNTYVAKTFSAATTALSPVGNEFTTRAAARYEDRKWQFGARYDTIGARFNDEIGYIPRSGVDDMNLTMGRRFRPRFLSKWVRESRPHWVLDIFSRQNGGGLESRYQDLHWPLQFQDGGNMEVGINPNVEVIRAPFTINSARGVKVNPGRYEFNEYFIYWNTNSAAKFVLNSRYSTGRFYDGHRRAYTIGPAIRLNKNFNASVNLQINDITLSTGAYVSKLLTSRLNYSFNTKMFINTLLQYNSDTRQWSSNLRFNIIHRPLSDIFVVYNDRRDERTGSLLNRSVIAKMTYLVAF